MKRFQSRRGSGRFQRNTLANTFGLQVEVLPDSKCRSFTTYSVGEAKPERCQACGTPFDAEQLPTDVNP